MFSKIGKAKRRRGGDGAGRAWRRAWPYAALALAAVVLGLTAGVAWALNYAGNVTVIATMGQLNPNPIRVGDTATASLSATYEPPGNFPEGATPSAQYSWSVSVAYKALYADSYGAPPPNSYTLSISPSQPSSSGGAELSFTPLIAGYWQLTGSCGVTVTDQAADEYWSGSANTGAVGLTSYILHIEYGGSVVDGQTHNVSVGERVALTADYGPADMVLEWDIPGQTLAGYGPAPGSSWAESAVATPVTTAELSKPDLTYYWVYVGTEGQYSDEKAVLKGFVSGGTLAASTTFGVYEPSGSIVGRYDGATLADDNYLRNLLSSGGWSGDIWLHFGGSLNPPQDAAGAYTPGTEFGATWSLPPAAYGNDFFAVQTISSFTIWLHTAVGDYGSQSPTEGSILDTSYPYGWTSPRANTTANTSLTSASTNDSPGIDVNGGSEAIYNLNFDMHLMFQPAGVDSIPVPVSGATWGWAASTLLINGIWQVGGANLPSPPSTASEEAEPQWSGNFLTFSPLHVIDQGRCEASARSGAPDVNARLLSPEPRCTAAQGVRVKLEPTNGTSAVVVALANRSSKKLFITTAKRWGWRAAVFGSDGREVPVTKGGRELQGDLRRWSRSPDSKYSVVKPGSGITNSFDLEKYFDIKRGNYFVVFSRSVGFPDKSGGLGPGCAFCLLVSRPAELMFTPDGKVRWRAHGVVLPPIRHPKMTAFAEGASPTRGPAASLTRLAEAVDAGNAPAARALVYAARGASQTMALVNMELSIRRLAKSVAAHFGDNAGKWTERQSPESNSTARILAHLDLPTLRVHGHWGLVRVWVPVPQAGKWLPLGTQYFRRSAGRWLVADNPVMAARFPEEGALAAHYQNLAKIFSGLNLQVRTGKFRTLAAFEAALNERMAAEGRAQLARLLNLVKLRQKAYKPRSAKHLD